MTEQELRALVRDAVARHLGNAPAPSPVPGPGSHVGSRHPSHEVYLQLVNVGAECVIEPSVTCNHCNYCKSHGH